MLGNLQDVCAQWIFHILMISTGKSCHLCTTRSRQHHLQLVTKIKAHKNLQMDISMRYEYVLKFGHILCNLWECHKDHKTSRTKRVLLEIQQRELSLSRNFWRCLCSLCADLSSTPQCNKQKGLHLGRIDCIIQDTVLGFLIKRNWSNKPAVAYCLSQKFSIYVTEWS